MLLAPFYREFELPWEGDPESESRFRKILRVLLILLILFGILFPLLPNPKPTAADTEVPQRIAQVMIEEKPKPPPPPPKPVEEKPKVVPEKKIPVTPPVDQKQVAHEKAQKQVNQFKDELADLRQQMDLTPLQT
jgi:periplasmic protein TonB